jgi:hypothetical protein
MPFLNFNENNQLLLRIEKIAPVVLLPSTFLVPTREVLDILTSTEFTLADIGREEAEYLQ